MCIRDRNEDAAHEMFLDDDWRSTKSDYGNMAQAMELGGDRLDPEQQRRLKALLGAHPGDVYKRQP